MKFKTMTQEEFTLLYNFFTVEGLARALHDPITKRPLSLKKIHHLRDKYGLPGKPYGRPIQEVVFKGEKDLSMPPQKIIDILDRLQAEELAEIEARRNYQAIRKAMQKPKTIAKKGKNK